MKTITEDTEPSTGTMTTGRTMALRSAGAASRLATRHADPARLEGSKPSDATGIVFDVVLFFAATLSLIAVIHQAQRPDTFDRRGVDSAPPAMFVNEG